jgi:hypothetical protein
MALINRNLSTPINFYWREAVRPRWRPQPAHIRQCHPHHTGRHRIDVHVLTTPHFQSSEQTISPFGVPRPGGQQ